MSGSLQDNLDEYRIKASILLKSLRSPDSGKAREAALRFQRLPHLAGTTPLEIVSQKESIRRKHALNVIALENGSSSWADFKRTVEKRNAIRSSREFTPVYPLRCDGFFNEWYASYEVAREHLDRAGGFLFPYRNHYFICGREYIRALGLDPADPDWERIGSDWVKPADSEAWQRLQERLLKAEAELEKADPN